jgi:hypothetical protein
MAATVVAASVLGTAGTASAATTVFVDVANPSCSDVGSGTPAAPFCSIQPAVIAAGPGTTISVNPGTYAGPVAVGTGKSGLKILGAGPGVIIAAPLTPMPNPGAVVRVTGSRAVRVSGLTVTGPGNQPCGTQFSGVRVDGNGKVYLYNDYILSIRNSPLSGCQNGTGVVAGRQADGTSGTAVVVNTIISDYQKNGVTISNTESFGFLRHVTITGAGPTNITAQNGVQISSGARAVIRDVSITGNVYSPQTNVATGVLLFQPGFVFLGNVTATANDVDIDLFGAIGEKIVRSTVTGATFQGVTADSTSTGSVLKLITASGNGTMDVQDDSTGGGTAGTANTWKKNTCGTSSPSGLCG